MNKKLSLLAGSFVLAFSAGAVAQTTWDLPSAYPASNFHVENLNTFIKDVDSLSGGKLKITLHNNARSEEHTSELQSLMRISYAVFCLKKKKNTQYIKPDS